MIALALRRPVRFGFASTTIATGMAGAVLLWSPGALASAGCTTTSPSIGQTIVACSIAGTESIPVPEGTESATVVVIGGGGASGGAERTRESGAGGNGARVSADLNLTTTDNLYVVVGSGGTGGGDGGAGGGFSAIYQGQDDSGLQLVVAGGGGGGARGRDAAQGNGGSGGHGAAANTAAGGAGDPGPGTGNFTGGQGGDAGVGGAGGDVGTGLSRTPGDNWSAGGAGGVVSGGGSAGGSGYGGGGAGGVSNSTSQGASGGGAGGSYVDPTLGSNLMYEALGVTPGANTPGAGGAARLAPGGQILNVLGESGRDGSITITFFIRIDPSSSTTSSSPTARSMALDFTLPSDVRCNFTAVEASQGSWVQVPSASDCTISGRATESAPTLLGWATDADFPVAIAQRQVDNGWGAYETKNEAGQLTGVFIPAGGYTAVTSDTNLHPIWSD